MAITRESKLEGGEDDDEDEERGGRTSAGAQTGREKGKQGSGRKSKNPEGVLDPSCGGFCTLPPFASDPTPANHRQKAPSLFGVVARRQLHPRQRPRSARHHGTFVFMFPHPQAAARNYAARSPPHPRRTEMSVPSGGKPQSRFAAKQHWNKARIRPQSSNSPHKAACPKRRWQRATLADCNAESAHATGPPEVAFNFQCPGRRPCPTTPHSARGLSHDFAEPAVRSRSRPGRRL